MRPGRSATLPFACGLGALLTLLLAAPGSSQTLDLKRDVPGAASMGCDVPAPPEAVSQEERGQAQELGSLADQAVILGDAVRARELLTRATQLDPASAELAFKLARVLDDEDRRTDAVAAYCTALALDASSEEAEAARRRLEALRRSERISLPDEAIQAFRAGVELADAGRTSSALEALDRAVRAAPGWPEAVYDRGVLHGREGQWSAAMRDLRRYLELRPDAPDASAVSEVVGRLEALASRPSPGTTLLVGLLPSAGQFYSGRPLAGMGVLALVGGAVATGLLVEDVEVLCLTDPAPGEDCPPGQVLDEESDRPYLVAGIGAAAAVTVIAALEAYIHVRGRNRGVAGFASLEVGGIQLVGPRLERVERSRLGVRLLQIRH